VDVCNSLLRGNETLVKFEISVYKMKDDRYMVGQRRLIPGRHKIDPGLPALGFSCFEAKL